MGTISFPNFGIEINPSQIAVKAEDMKRIFGFGKDIYWYGIIIALGFTLAVIYGLKRAKTFGLTQDHILDMLFVAVPFSIVCARLYYCIFYWELYADDPISMLYIWEGGMAIYGAVIGAVLSVVFFCKVKKLPFGPFADIGSLGLLIGQSVGRWGNFINREAHGKVYDGLFKMGIDNGMGDIVFYHPTFLYESVWNLIGFIFLHLYAKRRKFDGEVFLLYLAWYGMGRVWIEGLRTDSLYLLGTGIRVSQLLALISCLVAIASLLYIHFKKKPQAEQLYVNRATEAFVTEETKKEEV